MNKTKFFSMDYVDSKGEQKKYICRSGVMNWKDENGEAKKVLGTGHPTPETHIRLYVANRKGYRMFLKNNILRIVQKGIEYTVQNLAS